MLRSAGVGLLTAAWLRGTPLTLTSGATPEAVTAYAGWAPVPTESGTRGRGASGPGGHKRRRTALSRATVSATRYNPPITAFDKRLRAAGKPTTVARCAATRTLLHLAWAVVQTGRAFDPLYAQPRQEAAYPPPCAPFVQSGEDDHGQAMRWLKLRARHRCLPVVAAVRNRGARGGFPVVGLRPTAASAHLNFAPRQAIPVSC